MLISSNLRKHALVIACALPIIGCATRPSAPLAPEPEIGAAIESGTAAEPSVSFQPPPNSTNKITQYLSVQGRLSDTRLDEVSGLATSMFDENRLWAINDSGNSAELYALTKQATLTQVWPVAVSNRDWEAMASTSVGGVPFLLIADTGDNLTIYEESSIHLIEEPVKPPDSAQPLIPTATIRFTYPEGPQNVEAMAVSGSNIYLLTKERLTSKRTPSRLYRLTLHGDLKNTIQTAVYEGTVQMPQRGWKTGLVTRLLGIDPIQPTDLVISSDDNHAYVLNYLHVLHYERLAGETWPDALAKPPRIVHRHSLRQAEALTISADNHVWLTSESRGARLLAFTGAKSSNASRVSP